MGPRWCIILYYYNAYAYNCFVWWPFFLRAYNNIYMQYNNNTVQCTWCVYMIKNKIYLICDIVEINLPEPIFNRYTRYDSSYRKWISYDYRKVLYRYIHYEKFIVIFLTYRYIYQINVIITMTTFLLICIDYNI